MLLDFTLMPYLSTIPGACDLRPIVILYPYDFSRR